MDQGRIKRRRGPHPARGPVVAHMWRIRLGNCETLAEIHRGLTRTITSHHPEIQPTVIEPHQAHMQICEQRYGFTAIKHSCTLLYQQ
jgi:hypothetical protein